MFLSSPNQRQESMRTQAVCARRIHPSIYLSVNVSEDRYSFIRIKDCVLFTC